MLDNNIIGIPQSLCKLDLNNVAAIYQNNLQIMNINENIVIKNIEWDEGCLRCIIKLKDNTILIAEDVQTSDFCLYYLKQFIFENEELIYTAYRKDKVYKTKNNSMKKIEALIQLSNGVIAEGLSGKYNGKNSGDIILFN